MEAKKKIVFVAKPEIYGKCLISLHLTKDQGQVNSMQNQVLNC